MRCWIIEMNFVKNFSVSKHQNDLKLLAGFVQRSFTSGVGRNVESHAPILSTLAKGKSSLGTSRFSGLRNNVSGFHLSLRCHSSTSGAFSDVVTQGNAQDSARKNINSEKLTKIKTLMEIQVI